MDLKRIERLVVIVISLLLEVYFPTRTNTLLEICFCKLQPTL